MNSSEEEITVCSICDNGGNILCCEGKCFRAFHPTIADGVDSSCESLGYRNAAQVHELKEYFCKNCLYKQHQCYACGKLGSSDETSSQEVFPCSASNCGHFYHPICVAKLLHHGDKKKAEELQAKFAARDPLICPLHICKVCNRTEKNNLRALHFAVCRRCPTAYHRKCLPREITSATPQRTWENLLPSNRILMYCLNHEIVGNLCTPARDHLVFPDIPAPRRTPSYGLASSKVTDSKHRESRKLRKNFSGNKRKMESIGKTLSKEEGPSDFAEPNEVDEEDESRVLSIIEEVRSSFNFDEFVKSRESQNFGKKISLRRVKAYANDARAALKLFEEGRGDAVKTKLIRRRRKRLLKAKRTLKFYLSPFLHETSYTSFGRVFTKLEKLEEIVEKLHCYVQNGDTIVDFCCGSNDFSSLMKEKLEKTGKSCFFKNFDLIPAKNTFNFEKRNWLRMKKDELPDGSQLIMGLSPPFGKKSAFIKKALQFNPKILILIVPETETERVVPTQKKKKEDIMVDLRARYELIWDDTRLLSGKSFYLPGSLDVNNQTIELENTRSSALYLWSRKDWARSHKTTALQQGHIRQMHDDDSMVQDMDISP